MTDYLDLPFDEQYDERYDEQYDKGRHRRGARKKKKNKRGGGRAKTVLALLMTMILLGGLGGAAWYGFDRIQSYFMTPDYEGGGTGQVVVEVKAGALIADIGVDLQKAGVVKSVKAFIEAAAENPRSKGIQPGFYKVRKQMAAHSALSMLLDLKNKVTNQLTIPEGLSAKQTYLRLEKATKIPAKEFEAAAKDPIVLGVPDWWFKRTDGKKVTKSVEGFLYPDTYEIPPKPTAESILKQMVENFLTVTGKLDFAKRVEKERGGVSPYEALIVASLAQAEAGNKDDLGKIARVAYNRVYSGTFPCSCLEMDVTVNYWLELSGKKTKSSKEMTQSELNDTSNPYSRKLPGLPPTPIDNPGKEALEGAMNPPPGKWLFFVAIDKEGHSAFAETLEAQQRNEQKARENGVL